MNIDHIMDEVEQSVNALKTAAQQTWPEVKTFITNEGKELFVEANLFTRYILQWVGCIGLLILFTILNVALIWESRFWTALVSEVLLGGGFAAFVMTFRYPLLVPVIPKIPGGAKVMEWLEAIILGLLAVGLFFSLIPLGYKQEFWTKVEYLPVLMLAATTAIATHVFARTQTWSKGLRIAAWVAVIWATAMLFFGVSGNPENQVKGVFMGIAEAVNGKPKTPRSPPPPPQYAISPGDGHWAPPIAGLHRAEFIIQPMGQLSHWILPPEGTDSVILPERLPSTLRVQLAFASGMVGNAFWGNPMRQFQTMAPITGVRFEVSQPMTIQLAFAQKDARSSSSSQGGFYLRNPPGY